MRSLMIMVAVAGLFCSVSATQSYIAAKEKNTSVYRNRSRKPYEQEEFTINPDERVRVLKRNGRHLKVENQFQQTGWVEDRLVSNVTANRSFVFDTASVGGYLTNPNMAIVWGIHLPGDHELKLERSFRDALRENVDRETVLRVVKK